MKRLIEKLLQIKSKSAFSGIGAAQDKVDEEFEDAYVTSVGYSVSSEVDGLETLTQKTDFAEEKLEGTAIIQNNDVLSSMDRSEVVLDEERNISWTRFKRNYVGLVYYNADPEFENETENGKTVSDLAKDWTKQTHEGAYKYDLVSVGAPIHYNNLLQYLLNDGVSLNKTAELDKVRKS